jgi:cellulose synthase operon protein C
MVPLLLLLTACAGPGGLAGAGRAPSTATRRALDAWLQGGDPDAARGQLEALAAAHPDDPWSRLGAALMAERALQPERSVGHLVALVEANPDHPLALVALRELGRLAFDLPELAPAVERSLAGLRPRAPLQGLAAYRARVARIAAAERLGDGEKVAALRAENGAVTRWTVAGPFGAFAALDLDRPFPPEEGRLPASVAGPLLGPARPTHPLQAPAGSVALEGEPFDGAYHYLAADVDVVEGGAHLAMLRSEGPFRAWLDGAPLAERRGWTGTEPGQLFVAVTLTPGPHQLVVKLGREAGVPAFMVNLVRSDGRAARLVARPRPPGALLTVRPGPFPAPAWVPGQLGRALEEGGRAMAVYLAAADAVNDVEVAKALAEEGLAVAPRSAPLLALRGRLHVSDSSLDRQVQQARAEDALRRALASDPGDGPPRLELAWLLLAVERPGDAEKVMAGLPGPLAERGLALLVRARVARARDQSEAAEALAERALAAGARCGATSLLLEFAVQRDDVSRQDRLVEEGRTCPGGWERLAQHLMRRGDPAGARELLESIFRWRPTETRIGLRLAQARRAAGDPPGALAILRALRETWPRDGSLARVMADQLVLDGDRAGARAAREEALQLDGADLSTRRLLALEDGREALDDLAVDAEPVLRAYRAAAPRETGSAVLVLDAAAVEFHPGGASTERVHQVIRLLDQQAVGRYGEVVPPEDAQLLRLRTIKADGRVVEPDLGDAKGSHSLSNLEPGDFFELEYLRANRAPRPVPPVGAAPFYLAELGERIFFSSYAASAPRGFGLEAEARRLDARAAVAVSGDRELLRVERHDVARLQPEPHSPPAPELIPFVQVGVGDGVEPVQLQRANAMAGLLRSTVELRALAAQLKGRAGAGATPEALARAAWEETRVRLPGAIDLNLAPASAILSRGSGNRLVLMAALLDSLGVESRFALVKPFDANQETYRFGREESWAALLLRVALPGGPAWLDGSGRHVPFGALQERLRDREALILPRPGEPPTRDRTPASVPIAEGRESEYEVRLAADGSAELTGTEKFSGVIGAAAKELFLRADETQQRQAIEMIYAGSLTGLSIGEVTLGGLDEPDQPLTIRWRGRAPALAQMSGAGLQLEWLGPPSQLARQFATVSSRSSPLLVDELLGQRTRGTVVPPAGFAAPAAAPSQIDSLFGRYQRRERNEGGALLWEEELVVPLARISPADFPAFAAFAAAVDAAQGRSVALVPAQVP